VSLTLEASPWLLDAWGAAGRVPAEGPPTLEACLAEAWTGLAGRRAVACPVCGGEMAPVLDAGALPIGGRCHRCGSCLA